MCSIFIGSCKIQYKQRDSLFRFNIESGGFFSDFFFFWPIWCPEIVDIFFGNIPFVFGFLFDLIHLQCVEKNVELFGRGSFRGRNSCKQKSASTLKPDDFHISLTIRAPIPATVILSSGLFWEFRGPRASLETLSLIPNEYFQRKR